MQNVPNCPRLLPVPPYHRELTVKATHTGVIVLKEGRFKKRYTGSRQSAVDINGKLYTRAGELQKLLKADQLRRDGAGKKKPARASLPAPGNCCPYGGNEITENPQLSTKKILPRVYRVNKMEVRQRIVTMINTMKGGKELYFWTVSLPQGTADAVAYRLFNTWLTTLRQNRMIRNYIWVAERQQNGTIHYHIAIPHKMQVQRANKFMRGTLATLARNGEINYSVTAAANYNGVDIAKNRKTGRVTNFAIKKGSRSLANYLTKYVTKNDATFDNYAWHNSRGFSSLFTGITFTVDEFINAGFKTFLLKQSVINNRFFMFFPWLEQPPPLINDHLYQLNSYLQGICEN